MILVGAGGLAKSRSVRAVLGDSACWIEGNATPFGMYAKLYRHRDEFVVIDDVDALYADRSGVRLLKCLCQTEEEKAVAWHWDARDPCASRSREFTTKSRVVIISNDWQTLNKNVAALQDRGHVLLFQRAPPRLHAKAGTWFDDEEIYQWFAKNLHLVREPSLRYYVRAKELKTAGMDWTDVLATEDQNPRLGSPRRFWQAPLYDSYGGARYGVRPARGRMPGDLFQTTGNSAVARHRGPKSLCESKRLNWTKTFQHQMDHRQMNHRLTRPGVVLIVLAQTTGAVQPPERPLDLPPVGQHLEGPQLLQASDQLPIPAAEIWTSRPLAGMPHRSSRSPDPTPPSHSLPQGLNSNKVQRTLRVHLFLPPSRDDITIMDRSKHRAMKVVMLSFQCAAAD